MKANKIWTEYQKIIDCIKSCKTLEQLTSADRMIQTFQKVWPIQELNDAPQELYMQLFIESKSRLYILCKNED